MASSMLDVAFVSV